ncbi:phosphoribosylanthranilate isomerase [Desulfohalotomaculum tongense]|uniref:phosphoribosylanthranilate isomerase n=1 Tax=Desulforadius tongensis TaxID=1216062 RepID=UPI0019585215|nr:phosphoribosylanthranilate isomerase [Desulforadius tongensis]
MYEHRVRVKICGIQDLTTALAAVKYGAHALGFVFAPSFRQVSPDQAREISLNLPPFVSRVGVFVNASIDEVRRIAAYCNLDFVQLHGDEPPRYASELGLPVIKAFRVKDITVLRQAAEYPARAVLLDAYTPGAAGGTGHTFNWQWLKEVRVKCPVILAGGLTPDNVAAAIKAVRPYAVDVSSGVETGSRKDLQKIALFIRRAYMPPCGTTRE